MIVNCTYSLCLENTLSKYHLTEKVLLSYTINCQMVTPHIPKKEHRILFTCCNLSISLMWISRLLGKALWYTLYAVIESKPSGGSRRGARGTPYFWTKLRSEVPKKFWGETGSPLTKCLDDRPPPPLPPYLKVWIWHWSPPPPRPTDLRKMYGCANGCSLFLRECFWEQPWGSCGYQSKIFTKVNFPIKVTFL